MGSVAPEYVHARKLLTPGARLTVRGAELKWYDLHREESPIPEEVVQEAREFVRSQASASDLDFDDELGFVILHRVGDAYLLLVCTWRNENELWETVYAKDTGPFQLFPFDRPHKGTYCVWEMGAVRHEQEAWIRYLFSSRDESAAKTYLEDLPAASQLI